MKELFDKDVRFYSAAGMMMYETLAKGAADLFEQMIVKLESILGGLGDAQCTEPYKLFKEYLIHCFGSAVKRSDGMKQWESGLMAGDQKMPSEIQHQMNVKIFGRLLEFKCKFPHLDPGHEDNGALFPRYYPVQFLMAPL